MDEQGRRSIGDRIAERLMKRVARRARVGLSADFLARFGIPDPWSEADGLATGGDSADGMVFLSIKPYLARLRRLAWMRQHREERLANLAERYRLGGGLRALARLGLGSGASPRLGGLAGLSPISAGDMHLPRPPAPAVALVEPAVAEAGPARRRARGSDVRVSDSPWLITPFRPARVVRGAERPSVGSRADVDRATRVQAGAKDAAPAAPRGASRDAGWASPPTARIGQRWPAVAPGPAGRVASFIEAEGATLRRSASGRRVLRSLLEVEQVDEAQQVVTLRKIIRRAATARAVQVEAVEALLPAAAVTPARRAARRMDGPSGPGAGLRPVLAASPAMQAVRPRVVEQADAPAPVAERAVDRASRRARPSASATLFSSPVVGAPPPSSARIVRSAMGMVRGGRRPAPSRLSAVERVHPTDRATRRTRPSAAARPPSAAGASASSSDGGPGPSGPAEAAAVPVGTAGSVDASGAVDAARRVGGAPPAALPGAPPTARIAPEVELEPLFQSHARVRRSPAGTRPAAEDLFQEETALDPVARSPRRSVRSSERAFERLALVEPVGDAQAEGLSGDGEHRVDRARRWDAAVAPFALTRGPRGAFVPATTLARPEAAPVAEPTPAVSAAQAGPAPRTRSVPTPGRRATYVDPVVSTATVAPRARPTVRLAQRVPAVSSRPGSLLPVVVPESPQGPLRAPALSLDAPARRQGLGLPPIEEARREVPGRGVAGVLDRVRPERPSPRIAESPRTTLPTMSARGDAEPAAAPEARPRPVRPAVGARSPVEAAVERSVQAPLTASAARRVLAQAAAAQGVPVSELPVERMLDLPGQPVFFTRRRASPLAYARRLGRPDARVEWVGLAGSARAAGPSDGAPAPVRRTSGAQPQAVRALDALDLRALATAGWVGAFDESGAPFVSGRGAPVASRSLGVAAAGAVLRPLPASASGLDTADGPLDARLARARGRGPADLPGEARSMRSLAPATAWASQRSRRAAARSPGVSPRPQVERGRFDMLGVYRPPRDVAPGASPMNLAAPMSPLTRAVAAVEPSAAVSPGGLRPGLPGGVAVVGPAARPSLGVTLGAVDQGVTSPALPNWAQRASGEPRVRNETQFIEALARASEPEEILRVIYQRAARGNMTTAATGLPAPVIQVIEQIRAVAGAVEVDAGAAARGGPASDAEVVARSGVRSAAPRSTARVARGMSSLRGRGTAARRDGVGADKISKLSKKLQQLILLAEAQRQAARQQVRMAEDSAAARAEGHAAPTGGEGGNDRRVDIEALGREVLEVVSQELESRRVRSQEGSDEYGWW